VSDVIAGTGVGSHPRAGRGFIVQEKRTPERVLGGITPHPGLRDRNYSKDEARQVIALDALRADVVLTAAGIGPVDLSRPAAAAVGVVRRGRARWDAATGLAAADHPAAAIGVHRAAADRVALASPAWSPVAALDPGARGLERQADAARSIEALNRPLVALTARAAARAARLTGAACTGPSPAQRRRNRHRHCCSRRQPRRPGSRS
jgi:hypothetical protein